MSGISKRVSGSWVSGNYGIMRTSTDTITTLPAVLYPNAVTATVGLKGNMEQSGTPTPQNPIQPSECGERTGNLFDSSTIEVGGLSITTGAEITDNTRRRSGFISVEPSTNYGLSREITSSGSFFWVIAYDENKNIVTDATVSAQYSSVLVTGTGLTINQWTFTTTPTTKYIRWYVTVNNSYKNIMLNSGSTALPYEPFGVKIPISSASTTTPVYLGEVQSTRRIKELVLTGEENWTKNDVGNPSNYLYYQTGYSANKTCVCSHLADMGTLSTSKVGVFNANNVLYLNFGADVMNAQPSGNTVAGMKEYLAAQYANGTPVTIWYVLATPQTAIVNEPIRKIGDYADTVSSITVPMITGRDTFDVETTLKPSEASLNYTGWHDATVQEWDGSQWNE